MPALVMEMGFDRRKNSGCWVSILSQSQKIKSLVYVSSHRGNCNPKIQARPLRFRHLNRRTRGKTSTHQHREFKYLSLNSIWKKKSTLEQWTCSPKIWNCVYIDLYVLYILHWIHISYMIVETFTWEINMESDLVACDILEVIAAVKDLRVRPPTGCIGFLSIEPC